MHILYINIKYIYSVTHPNIFSFANVRNLFYCSNTPSIRGDGAPPAAHWKAAARCECRVFEQKNRFRILTKKNMFGCATLYMCKRPARVIYIYIYICNHKNTTIQNINYRTYINSTNNKKWNKSKSKPKIVQIIIKSPKKQTLNISHWRRAAAPTFSSFPSAFRHQAATQHDGVPPLAARRRAGLQPGGEKEMEKQIMLVWLLFFKPKNKYLDFCSRCGFPSLGTIQSSNVQTFKRLTLPIL